MSMKCKFVNAASKKLGLNVSQRFFKPEFDGGDASGLMPIIKIEPGMECERECERNSKSDAAAMWTVMMPMDETMVKMEFVNDDNTSHKAPNATTGTKQPQQQCAMPQGNAKTVEAPAKKTRKTAIKFSYLCHRCQQTFIKASEFDQHYKQAYNSPPIYSCTICDKQLRNRRSYQNHVVRHQQEKQFTCTVCAEQFQKEHLYHLHNINVHQLSSGFKCADCTKEFTDLKDYKAHCRTHNEKPAEEPRKWQCAECGKMLKNRSSLNMHSKIHKNDRPFSCSICDQKFVQKINLIQHVKSHNDVKPYTCSKCGKCFVGEAQLQRHHTYHSNVRSFECDVCKKMYKSKRDLRLHRMIHSNQRPHKCSDCEKTFLSTSKLKQHSNIHTGSRPYKCKYCSKDFTNFPNWLKHTRRRHKVDHKTGEKLVEMPTFLKSKPNKKPVEKKAVGRPAVSNVIPNQDAQQTNGGLTNAPLKIVEIGSLMESNAGCQPIGPSEALTNALDDLMLYPLATQKAPPKTDLTTITVNDKTLPLNNADDLERAASLLMQQTLDIEDEVEFHGIKCEAMDHDLYADQSFFGCQTMIEQSVGGDRAATGNAINGFTRLDPTAAFLNNDFFSYYYENTALQYNFQPTLPPITTVKCRINQETPHTFTSTTNVL